MSFSNGKTRAGQAWGSGRDAVWGERARQARSGMWVGCPTKAPFTATGRACPGGAVLGTGRRPARGRLAVTHPRRLNTDRWPRPRIPCGRPQLAVPSVVPETVPACWVPVRYQGGLAPGYRRESKAPQVQSFPKLTVSEQRAQVRVGLQRRLPSPSHCPWDPPVGPRPWLLASPAAAG